MLNHTRAFCALALASVTLLAGCASAPKATSSKAIALPPEQAVAARAGIRWQAMIERRWEDAYSLLTPGYREATTLEGFQANFVGSPVNWKSFEVGAVVCEIADRCVAEVLVHFSLTGGMPGVPKMETQQTVQEIWLLVGGDWHHLPRK